MYIPDILLLILGLFVLILGGDFLVRGASNIALKIHISPLVVGLTIVAFGTSAPELLISIKAALSGSPDLTMGNVVGSNICNLALVLGVTLLVGPLKVNKDSIIIDWPMTMGASLILLFISFSGEISWWEGLLCVIILITYTFFIIRKSRKETKLAMAQIEYPDEEASDSSYLKDIGWIILGGAGLYFGSDWFVEGAKALALGIGVSERVIGITVLALGTSLPELVTAIVASFKGETDLALGNLLGSNIFNVLSILGITSMINEISVNEVILQVDMVWMLGITALILPMMLIKRKMGIVNGIILLIIYVYYTYTVIS